MRFMAIRRFAVVGLIAGRKQIRSVSLLVVTGTFVALAFLASSVPAAAENPALIITKECSQFSGKVPSFCTITSSNLPEIPVGSKVLYYGPEFTDPDYTSSWVILQTPVHGNRATGYCSLLGTDGNCSFFQGTGTLAGFHAAVQVTLPGDEFLREGTYRFDPHH
jgi:hypothetical protein